MADHTRGRSPYQTLRDSRRVLARMAPLVRFGLFTAGVSLFLEQARPLLSDSQFTWGERRVMGAIALITLGGFGLAAWVADRLLRTAAELIDAAVDGIEAAERTADLIERHMVPALNRIASALERSPSAPRNDAQAQAEAAARKMIESQRWEQAERLVRAFTRDYPGTPEASILTRELSEARQGVVDGLRAELDAARDGGDPNGVIEVRDQLTEHLRGAALSDLDREVVRWLMDWIQERILRSGTVSAEMAGLAERVADSFGDTDEGAKLRTALPQLRRRAGLCPQCGRPHRGRPQDCPHCRVSTPLDSSGAPETEVVP